MTTEDQEIDLVESRKKFAIRIVILISTIVLLPPVVNTFLRLLNTYGAATMLLRAIILPLGAIIAGVMLFFVTKRRLRDLKLSGVLLLAFPIWPIYLLASGPIQFFFGEGWLMMGNRTLLPPYFSPQIWLGVICVLMLALVSGNNTERGFLSSIFGRVQSLTNSQEKIGNTAFKKKIAVPLTILTVILFLPYVFDLLFPHPVLFFHPEKNVPGFGTYLEVFAVDFLGLLVTLTIIPLVIRRLRDIGYNCKWAAPFVFIHGSFAMTLSNIFIYFNQPERRDWVVEHIILKPINLFGGICMTILFLSVLAWLMLAKSVTQPR